MSLGLALSSATSGLLVNQQAISILTQNITNANTTGYTRQVLEQAQRIVGSTGGGVDIAGVVRQVDVFLVNAARLQISTVGRVEGAFDFLDRAQFFLGQPGAGNDISTFLDNFYSAITDLSVNPELSFARANSVQSAVTLAQQVSTLATNLEQTRFEADREIGAITGEVNNLIDELFELNRAIARADTTGGGAPNALFDARDVALDRLRELVDVNVRLESDGRAQVSLINTALLSDTSRFHLDHTAATNVNQLINNGTLGSIDAVLLDANGNQTSTRIEVVSSGVDSDITTILGGGRLKGLLEVRDQEIPNMLAQLDEFAAQLRDQVNRVHNDGIGFPPPVRLTGTRLIDPAEERIWSGDARLALLGADGQPVVSPYASETHFRPLTIDFDTLQGAGGQGRATVGDIMKEINQYYTPAPRATLPGPLGAQGLANMTLRAIGNSTPAAGNAGSIQLDLELDNIAPNAVNVVVTGITTPAAGVTVPGGVPAGLAAGVSVPSGQTVRTGNTNAFTVNFDGTQGAGPYTVDVAVTIDGEAHTIRYTIPESGTNLRNDRFNPASVQAGTAAIEVPTDTNPRVVAEMVDANGNVVGANESGFLRIRAADGTSRIGISELTSNDGGISGNTTSVTNRGFSHYFELNNFFTANNNQTVNSAVNLAVQQRIIDDPGLLSAGQLVQKDSGDPLAPVFTYELGSGNAQAVNNLLDLQFQQINFNAAGSLPGVTLNLGGYVSEVISFAAFRTSLFEADLTREQLILQGLEQRRDASSGVNIDEELANTVRFQASYQANTRIISVVDEMLDALFAAVG